MNLSLRGNKTCRGDKTCRQCITFDTFCHLGDNRYNRVNSPRVYMSEGSTNFLNTADCSTTTTLQCYLSLRAGSGESDNGHRGNSRRQTRARCNDKINRVGQRGVLYIELYVFSLPLVGNFSGSLHLGKAQQPPQEQCYLFLPSKYAIFL